MAGVGGGNDRTDQSQCGESSELSRRQENPGADLNRTVDAHECLGIEAVDTWPSRQGARLLLRPSWLSLPDSRMRPIPQQQRLTRARDELVDERVPWQYLYPDFRWLSIEDEQRSRFTCPGGSGPRPAVHRSSDSSRMASACSSGFALAASSGGFPLPVFQHSAVLFPCSIHVLSRCPLSGLPHLPSNMRRHTLHLEGIRSWSRRSHSLVVRRRRRRETRPFCRCIDGGHAGILSSLIPEDQKDDSRQHGWVRAQRKRHK